MGFLGVYPLWTLLSDFAFGTLTFGIVWIGIGYRMLYTFWIITELSRTADESSEAGSAEFNPDNFDEN